MRGWLASLGRGQRIALGVAAVLVVGVAVGGLAVLAFLQRNEAEAHAGIDDHFKYGSIGSEAGSGIPYWIWRVLPDVFPNLLPDGPGEGYERFGFIYEDGRDRPIGTSYRESPFPMLGLNCSVCHTGTVRTAPDAEPMLILGMPAQQLDFLGYQRFLLAAAEDERFDADTLIPAIERINPDFGLWDRLTYRFVVIPRLQSGILDLAEDFAFLDERPEWGPGRVDTFSPYKVHFGFDMTADESIGTSDFPPLFAQAIREGMWLHWDGNNDSLAERNISAALGAGATEDSLDHEGIGRVADWALNLPPPPFPGPIDESLAEAGRAIYATQCASCHAHDGDRVGTDEPLSLIGTDPERATSFTAELAERMNTFGEGRPWRFSRFTATDGYANMPLDGVWLRAPFLHNGSVPTLRDLLRPPEERPTEFYRGYDVYDLETLGFVSSGPEAEEHGFRFDTTLRGNGNGGHTYGTDLTPDQIDALIEFLKTQ